MPLRKRTTKPALVKRRPRGRKAAQKSSVASVVKQMISTHINKKQETKQASRDMGFVNFNGDALSATDCLNVIPDVVQGIREDQRIGTDIRAMTLSCKGHINVNPIHLDKPRSRMLVRMVVVQPKAYKKFNAAVSNFNQWLNQILRFGALTQGLDGSIRSMYLPINTDICTCYVDKKFYMKTDYYEDAQAGNFNVSFATKLFNFNIKVKDKILKFNDSSENSPYNFAPMLLYSYCFLDGSPPVFLTTAISAQAVSVLTYKDA